MYYCKVILKGKATRRYSTYEGQEQIRTASTTQIFRMARICPSHIELHIRRMHWYQSVAQFPHQHKQLHTCWVGMFGFESKHTVSDAGYLSNRANPWAKQIISDVMKLKYLEGGEEFLQEWGRRPMMLFNLSDIAKQFCEFDVALFRHMLFDGTLDDQHQAMRRPRRWAQVSPRNRLRYPQWDQLKWPVSKTWN